MKNAALLATAPQTANDCIFPHNKLSNLVPAFTVATERNRLEIDQSYRLPTEGACRQSNSPSRASLNEA